MARYLCQCRVALDHRSITVDLAVCLQTIVVMLTGHKSKYRDPDHVEADDAKAVPALSPTSDAAASRD